MKAMKKAGIALAIVLLMAFFLAPQSQAAERWKTKFMRFSATAGAGQTLVTGDVVCFASVDGRVYKADADDPSRRPAVGVIDKGGTEGSTVEIVISGILAGQTDASAGSPLYLSTTAGALTTTKGTGADAYVQVLGVVMQGLTGEIDNVSESTMYFIHAMPTGISAN